MTIYILTQSDGYSISKLGQSTNRQSMIDLMNKSYQDLYPYKDTEENETWNNFKNMSEIGDDNAILYDRGENVYVWQILTVDIPHTTIVPDITIAPSERSSIS